MKAQAQPVKRRHVPSDEHKYYKGLCKFLGRTQIRYIKARNVGDALNKFNKLSGIISVGHIEEVPE